MAMKDLNQITTNRLLAIDAFRGLIMVLMALDHAQFFVGKFHPLEYWQSPLPQYQNGLVFLTRLTAHFCAPGFFFLLGMSMVFFTESRQTKGWSQGKIDRHFLLRGVILLVLQQFIINPAWFLGTMGSTRILENAGDGGPVWFNLDVLFSLGLCMILLIPMIRLKKNITAIISIITILIAQFLIPHPDHVKVAYSLWERVFFIPGQTDIFLINYPILFWVGVSGLGLAMGKWVQENRVQAFRYFPIFGFGSLLIFVFVRAFGSFGNFHPPIDSNWITFLNTTKYPPSLAFLLLTLGANFLFLTLLQKWEVVRKLPYPLLIFGKAALFFYILHLYIYAIAGFFFPMGASLSLVYLVWIAGLVLLFFLCVRYIEFRKNTSPKSFWRLI
jgi:uncharacterized membrane protein